MKDDGFGRWAKAFVFHSDAQTGHALDCGGADTLIQKVTLRPLQLFSTVGELAEHLMSIMDCALILEMGHEGAFLRLRCEDAERIDTVFHEFSRRMDYTLTREFDGIWDMGGFAIPAHSKERVNALLRWETSKKCLFPCEVMLEGRQRTAAKAGPLHT